MLDNNKYNNSDEVEVIDDVEVFTNDIELYLKTFLEEHKISDMTKEPQSRWNAALMYINKHVFSDKSKLKYHKDNIPKDINNNCVYCMYDFNKLNEILYIYYYLCAVYDKECSIIGFSLLTGINRDTLQDWGADERKLSKGGFDIIQKLKAFREESLSNKLATGNKNPVGILAILNRHYAWNLPGVSRESSNKVTLTAADIRAKLFENDKQLDEKNDEQFRHNLDSPQSHCSKDF